MPAHAANVRLGRSPCPTVTMRPFPLPVTSLWSARQVLYNTVAPTAQTLLPFGVTLLALGVVFGGKVRGRGA